MGYALHTSTEGNKGLGNVKAIIFYQMRSFTYSPLKSMVFFLAQLYLMKLLYVLPH